MIYRNLDLKNIKLIQEVVFNESAKKAREHYCDWDLIRKFPSKNNVGLTSFLIGQYSSPRDLVIDPMAGIGTTLIEARRLGRHGIGFEIHRKNVDLIKASIDKNKSSKINTLVWEMPGQMMWRVLGRRAAQLIVTSPPYGTQNHSMGKGKKQLKIQKEKSCFSCQDYSDEVSEWEEFRLDGISKMGKFWDVYDQIIVACEEVLVPGGYLAVILQDYIRKGKPVGLVQKTVDLALACDLDAVGYYERQLNMSLFKNMQLAKGNNVVGVEHTLVFRRKLC